MARTQNSDKLLFLVTLLLVATGVVMVYSASAVLAMEKYHRPYYFLFKQGAWALVGLCVLGATMRLDYRVYKQPVVVWTAVGGVTIALVAVLFSHTINGTARWFSLPGITIQPSELAKLAAIVFTAALLDRRMYRIDDIRYALAPVAIVTLLFVGLILLEPDFGTAAALFGGVAVMVFVAGLNRRYLIAAGLALLPTAAVVLISAPYRVRRLLSFLHPDDDLKGAGFHALQSKIAVGSGGVFGKGWMEGVQKLFYLPEPHTDSIYAVISEELGLIGATIILACFCVVAWRGLRAAVLAPDRFGSLMAIGLTTMIAVQAFVNVSVVLGLLPNKGMPLPFISNGGSSLLINLLGMGILLNISQQASTMAAKDLT
jgi:cell division protein FtsW